MIGWERRHPACNERRFDAKSFDRIECMPALPAAVLLPTDAAALERRVNIG